MRVLVIDDHELFRSGLCMVLATLLPRVRLTEMPTGEQACYHLMTSQEHPDVALMDWHIPGEDGVNNVVRLRSAMRGGRLVVLSGDDSQQLIAQCVEAGAAGFIAKNTSTQQLRQALEHVIAGGVVFPPLAYPEHIRMAPQRTDCSDLDTCFPMLTPRQQDVLKWVAKGASNKVIARALGISDDTVKQHVSSVCSALGVRTRTEVMYRLSILGVRVTD